jgi:tetratricopeptide (TPR) repeat protein
MSSEHDRVIADCTEAIRLNPRDCSAYARRGAAYRMKGEYDRAIADCTEAIRLNPNEFAALSDRGVAYRITGDHHRAIADCSDARRLKSLPDWKKDDDWWTGKDWWEWDDASKKRIGPMTLKEFTILIQAKKITGGTTVWKEGMGKEWAKAETMPELQAAFNPQCEHSRAIADLTEAIRVNPNDARAFAKRGDIYRKKNDHDRAIADLTEAIRLNTTFSWAFAVRGETFRAKNWLANANAAIRRLGTGEPESSFLKTDDYDRAIADISEAIRLDPATSAWASYLSRAFADRGKTFRRMLNYDRAIADCTEAIRLDPKNAEAFAVRGDVRWARDEYDLATADLTEAVRLDPNKDHKDLLDKVNRSIRNAAAKDQPASKPETKQASTPVAKTPTQKPSKPPPVQPPQQAPSTFTTICVYCFTEYSCSEPIGTVLHCNRCDNQFKALRHLGHKKPSALGWLTGMAFGASGLYAGDVLLGEKCPGCGTRGAQILNSDKVLDFLDRRVRTEKYIEVFLCNHCNSTFIRASVTETRPFDES